ncbi:MAG: response regulator transcription factor [Planctomycetaceae bacterium]|nr:response regulator transcription factor [Planctomycetaceae bacterium]
MAHIIVVEDEEHLAKGIQFNLQAEGYEVKTVSNGRDALLSIEENPDHFDLVILDLMLPEMSGYAVCQKLRDAGEVMPILILSARTLTEDRTRGFDAGADQYLTKPFELDELLSRVKGLLMRHGRQKLAPVSPRSEVTIGAAVVNFETFEVVRGESIKRMTPLEIKLLQFLIETEGRIVSRQELMKSVWDQPGHFQTRAPDQFIRRLRKSFEVDPSQPKHFLTIRDAGYRFVLEPEDDVEPVEGHQ